SQPRVGGRSQHSNRLSLGCIRREVDGTIKQGTLAAATRVILSNNTPTTAALLQQTRTVPIVFATVADPIGSGFVAGLSQPGGNAPGFVTTEASLGGKWVELLRDIAPRVSRIAILFNPTAAPYADYYLKPIKAASASFAVEAAAALVHNAQEIESVIAA